MIVPGPGTRQTPLPQGFAAFDINSGVRKYRPDLGVLFSKSPCTAAATFTTNTAQGHHVVYCKQLLPSEQIQAIVTNSGQANTATGKQGELDNLEMVELVAQNLELKPEQVLSASTGVIGVPLEMEKISAAMGDLFQHRSDYAEGFATAVMTTDLVPKTFTTSLDMGGHKVRITGICKGSGMIHPNMATMLGYLLTDLAIDKNQLVEMLKDAVDESFNMLSVDGETSPNDTVFFLANGASGAQISSAEEKQEFLSKLRLVARHMAKSIARDGEGAGKLIEVQVRGLPNLEDSRRLARSLTVSPLLKTAIHGEDANWGRIYSRIGQEGVARELIDQMELRCQGVAIMQKGAAVPFDYNKIRVGLSKEKIVIEIDFAASSLEATAWGCDLSKKYVEINTKYN